MATYDTIIQNGTIFDGTRIPRYKGTLALRTVSSLKSGGLMPAMLTKFFMQRANMYAPALSTSIPTTTLSYSGIPIAPCRAGMASPRS